MRTKSMGAPLWVLLGSSALLVLDRPASSQKQPPPQGVLGAFVRGPDRVVAGTPAALRIATHWASSEKESGPWANVAVEVELSGKGRREVIWRGRTDASGVADARFRVPSWPDGKYTVAVAAHTGTKSDRSLHDIELAPGAKVLLESDKPMYQPGQTIHLRAVAVRPQDGRPLASHALEFEVTDSRGNQLLHREQTTSAYGVAAIDLPLADEILLGKYHARAKIDDQVGELAVEVARYALPKIKVALATDRAWYRPGDRVKIDVDGNYFFGKPADGAKVELSVDVAGSQASWRSTKMEGKLDAKGHVRLELDKAAADVDDGSLRLTAIVSDAAGHRESAAREVPIARNPLKLEIVPEAGRLAPGVANRVWVIAARPDGAPAAGVTAKLAVDGGKPMEAKTDAIGVATFEITAMAPQRGRRSGTCYYNQISLAATVDQRSETHCAAVGTGGLLLRTDRAIYSLGAKMDLDIVAPGTEGGLAFVDVVKDGQTVDTVTVPLNFGRGHATLSPDERRFGTLALLAYRIAPDGARTQDGRMVYVERPGSLRVEVRGDKNSFEPGESGKIRLHVVDGTTGQGVQASVGVVMVDQALLALRPVRPGAARTYFTLAREASEPKVALKATPGGYTLEKLIDESQLDSLKQEAAMVLLAGAQPPWSGAWETDPWALRKQRNSEQQSRIMTAADSWTHTHASGERAGNHWRWRHDLLAAMISDGVVHGGDVRDPWGRAVTSQKVIELAGLGDFDQFAHNQVEERLRTIYLALAREKKRGEVTITQADLERLVEQKKVPKWAMVDPWGQPFRIEQRKKAVRIDGLKSTGIVASAGPDGIAGNKDDLYPYDAHCGYGQNLCLLAAKPAEVFGMGGLGLIGHGAGGGGYGYGAGMGSLGGRVARAPSIVMGAASLGNDGRVRSDFPETMLWRPEVITDEHGDATLDVNMADSITTWRLGAEAIAADGRLGAATADVRVFQDFFVDLDLPPVATQHDELSVPVAVYNYLPGPQHIELELANAAGVEQLGNQKQSIDLAPSQVGVRHFRVRFAGVGRTKLLVRARGQGKSDAVERSLEIFPDGIERALSFQDRLGKGAVHHELAIAGDAIVGASDAEVKVYPGMASHVIEGLDSMLRMPGGCFEQTSSSNYPNALILDYLRKSGKATPAVEKRAKEYLALGYQKLLSFEVRGGGFSWFGDAPANKILTAYGLEEFHDMSRVFSVDKRVVERTQKWLIGAQKQDGSWAPDTHFINEGATNHFNTDVVRITAYIALALKHTGADGPAVDRATAFVRKRVSERTPDDAYTLALALELLAHDREAGELESKLWRERREDGKLVSFTAREKTPTYGDGKSGTVETTALAAQAMLATPGIEIGKVDRAVGYLLGSKDTFGNWYSTQATIRSLKTLLAFETRRAQKGKGTLSVMVDGQAVASVTVDGSDDAMQVIKLGKAVAPGKHDVQLRYEGTGQVSYQIVGRYWEPRKAPEPAGEIAVSTSLDDKEVKVGGDLLAEVQVTSHAKEAIDMPIVTAGLPPGFEPDQDALDKLVRSRQVEKVQRTPREVIFYLRRLDAGQSIRLPVRMTAKFPVRAQVPAATAYEYYRPERRAAGDPIVVVVKG
jgi:hypothetical protein